MRTGVGNPQPQIAVKVVAIIAALLATGAGPLSPPKCGHGHFPPCPPPPPPPITLTLSFVPPDPSIPDNTPVGSLIAQIIVTVSDGSQFSGSLGFGLNGSDGGFCAISGSTVILGVAAPMGASMQNCTITATQ
jgi:hypothetical protein